jgi:hypothetical protein
MRALCGTSHTRRRRKHLRNPRPPTAAKKRIEQTFSLKTTSDEWVKGAYKRMTPEYQAPTARAVSLRGQCSSHYVCI